MKKLLFTFTLLTASHALQAAGTGPLATANVQVPENQMANTAPASMSSSEQALETLLFMSMFLPTDQAGIERIKVQMSHYIQAGLTTFDVALLTMNRFLHQDTVFTLTPEQKNLVQGVINVLITVKGFIPQTTVLANQMLLLAPQKEALITLFEKNQEGLLTTLLDEYKKAVQRTTEQDVRTALEKTISMIEEARNRQQKTIAISTTTQSAADRPAIAEQPQVALKPVDQKDESVQPIVTATQPTLLNAPENKNGMVEIMTK